MASPITKKGGALTRYVWVSAWYAFAAVVVLVAVLFASVRLLLPYAEQYSVEVGERLSEYLERPVEVQALDAEWHGLGPSLVLREVALLDAAGELPVLELAKIRVGFDLLASLRQWQPVFSNITLVGVDLSLTRNSEGAISVAGFASENEAATPSPDDVAPFMAWLFSQGRLGLEDSNITWRDEMGAGRKLRLSAVNLILHNDGDRHQLNASLKLPRNLGKSLILRVDMHGDPRQTMGRKIRVFVAGEHVRLGELFEPQALAGVDVSIKSASFQVWADWRGGFLQQIKGNVDAGGLRLARVKTEKKAAQTLSLDHLAGDFVWRGLADGWEFNGDDLMLTRQSRQWLPSRMALKFVESSSGLAGINASASFLQLEDIKELLSLFAVGGAQLQEPLFAINPRGEIRDAELSWQADKNQYRAYAQLRNASVNAWRAIPEARNVDGQLWLDTSGGQADLQYAKMTLDFPNLFRWPLTVNELRGNVSWQAKDGQWQVVGRQLEASNDDITASATLDVVSDAPTRSPFMSLVVNFHDGDGSQVARYLPTGIMNVDAVNWLDEAIVGAHVVSGGALFHGRLADFPFDKGDGRFEVSFRAEDATLNYAPNWPPITDISADVQFFGRGMSVAAQKGKIFSNDIQWANVTIADMTTKPLMLNVAGEVQGSTQEKLDYLVGSPPLYDAFAQHLEGMTAEGDSLLKLNLSLPIGSGEKAEVSGWVDMAGNSLTIPPLGQVLSQVNGRLSFFEHGLQATDIQADLFGQNTQINIATDESAVDPKVRIRAQGLFEAPDLAARYLPPIQELLAGNGDWTVSFDIPLSGEQEAVTPTQRVAVLQARTNLKGVEARLPPPFDKKADEAGSLELRVDFPPKQQPVLRVNYEGFVDGIFALGEVATEPLTENGEAVQQAFRGEVRINGGAAQMPEQLGLRLTGWLDNMSLDDWRHLRLVGEEEGNDSQLFTSADIAFRELEIYDQQLHNLRFKFSRADGELHADIDSQELKGQITLPGKPGDKPVRVRLKHWYIAEMEGGGADADPRELPALDLVIDDFRFKNRQFGSVRLETAKVQEGVRIEQLVIKPRSTTITANGSWYVRGDQQTSNLQMHVQSRNIGHTLRAFDYVGGIDKGKGSAELELEWPGSLADVSANTVQGTLDMSLKDGYLLDVDPGAGRMFGMLSIQTLPRRLLLDFSDVFKKGFGFDRIEGTFDIEDGDAYTNNLYMEGPAARVDITGRTGLAQQDYDQLVTVTPHVADTLPVIGALTATPQVGAAILAIQKIFLPAIDDATQNQYTITGSWNEPRIKKIKAEKEDKDKAKANNATTEE